MQKALKTRFKFIIDCLHSDFDGIYMAATYLTPAYKGILSSSQTEQAKLFLLDIMKQEDNQSKDAELVMEVRQSQDSEETSEPPKKRFKHLERVSELLNRKELEEEETDSQEITNEEEEIEKYNKSKISAEELQLDPILYWINNSTSYPLLSPVACDILSTPASSAPVERCFSVSGQASKGLRNRLLDHNLERETLLRKNKKYL